MLNHDITPYYYRFRRLDNLKINKNRKRRQAQLILNCIKGDYKIRCLIRAFREIGEPKFLYYEYLQPYIQKYNIF